MNKTPSEKRELCDEGVPTADGIGGTGGTRTSEPLPERLVTPGIYAIWMMFEARVRTVDAIEATVCVEARDRASRVKTEAFDFSIPSSSSSSHSSSISTSCRLPLSQNFQMQNTTIAMKATPPMTPPTIAPILGPDDFEEELTREPDVAADTHAADGQVSQSPNV